MREAPSRGPRNVFTYGSLMFAEVWGRVVHGAYGAVAARLVGHRRHEVRGQTYPGMIACDGAAVEGVLYLDVAADDLERLDRFEGADYRRITVSVDCADGAPRAGETYLYLRHDLLLDAPWKAETFAMQRFLETYCADKLGP